MANRNKINARKSRGLKKCRKDRFDTQFDAQKRGSKIGLRAYFCFECKGFHLTSQAR